VSDQELDENSHNFGKEKGSPTFWERDNLSHILGKKKGSPVFWERKELSHILGKRTCFPVFRFSGKKILFFTLVRKI